MRVVHECGGITYCIHSLLMMMKPTHLKSTYSRYEGKAVSWMNFPYPRSREIHPTVFSPSFSRLRESSACVRQSWQKSQRATQTIGPRSRPRHGTHGPSRRAPRPPLPLQLHSLLRPVQARLPLLGTPEATYSGRALQQEGKRKRRLRRGALTRAAGELSAIGAVPRRQLELPPPPIPPFTAARPST